MLFAKLKDAKTRSNFYKNEHKIKTQKYVLINLVSKLKNLNSKIKKIKQPYFYKSLYFNYTKKNFRLNKIKIINRCLLTNKSRSYNKNFNISRNILRKLLQFGLVPGYKKAVW